MTTYRLLVDQSQVYESNKLRTQEILCKLKTVLNYDLLLASWIFEPLCGETPTSGGRKVSVENRPLSQARPQCRNKIPHSK